MDEETAIQKMKDGDIAGLELLVHRYQLRAVRAAFLITRDRQSAEDVVQDTFIRAFRSIRSFDPARAFEPWFMRSVVNAAIKVAQRGARQVRMESDDPDGAFEALLHPTESAEQAWGSAAFQEEIRGALDRLPPRQRATIVQRYYLDMSEKEMADELEVAPGTVKWLLHSARTKLRALLSERSAE
jgi:RNA polymerase sigma-70 factor (ECF subfamily)